jgi:hypothetical protein
VGNADRDFQIEDYRQDLVRVNIVKWPYFRPSMTHEV